MRENITLNRDEQKRLHILNQVMEGKLVARQAAELMNRSVRQRLLDHPVAPTNCPPPTDKIVIRQRYSTYSDMFQSVNPTRKSTAVGARRKGLPLL